MHAKTVTSFSNCPWPDVLSSSCSCREECVTSSFTSWQLRVSRGALYLFFFHLDQTALYSQTEFRNTALDMPIFSEEALKPQRLHAQSLSLMHSIYKYILHRQSVSNWLLLENVCIPTGPLL